LLGFRFHPADISGFRFKPKGLIYAPIRTSSTLQVQSTPQSPPPDPRAHGPNHGGQCHGYVPLELICERDRPLASHLQANHERENTIPKHFGPKSPKNRKGKTYIAYIEEHPSCNLRQIF